MRGPVLLYRKDGLVCELKIQSVTFLMLLIMGDIDKVCIGVF